MPHWILLYHCNPFQLKLNLMWMRIPIRNGWYNKKEKYSKKHSEEGMYTAFQHKTNNWILVILVFNNKSETISLETNSGKDYYK